MISISVNFELSLIEFRRNHYFHSLKEITYFDRTGLCHISCIDHLKIQKQINIITYWVCRASSKMHNDHIMLYIYQMTNLDLNKVDEGLKSTSNSTKSKQIKIASILHMTFCNHLIARSISFNYQNKCLSSNSNFLQPSSILMLFNQLLALWSIYICMGKFIPVEAQQSNYHI